MWVDAAIGFGGVLLLGLIGFIYAWRGIERERRERLQGRTSESESH